MPANLSPTVNITEADYTNVVPAVTSSVGAMIIHAEKGPVNVKTLLTNPQDLETIFGRPTDVNYTHWFTAEAFLKQSNALWVVRVEDSTKAVAGLTVGLSASGMSNLVLSTSTTKETSLFPLTYSDIKSHEAKIDYSLTEGSGSGQLDNAANNLYTQDNYHFFAVGPGTFYERMSVMVVNSVDYSTLISLKGELAETTTTDEKNTIAEKYYNGTPATTATSAIDYLSNSLVKYDLIIPAVGSGDWFIDTGLLSTLTAFENGPDTSDEGVLVVFDEYDQATPYVFSNIFDKVDALGNKMFGPTIVNANDKNLYFFIGNSETDAAGIELVSTRKTFLGGADLLTGEEVGTSLADLTGEIITAFTTNFSNPEELSVDILIDADYPDAVKRVIDQLAKEIRKDCFSVLNVPLQYLLNVTNKRPIASPYSAIKNYVDNILNINSSYSAIYGNYFKIYDRFAEKERWVPTSGFVAAAMAYTDFTDAQWFAVAGINRGIISNVIDVAVNPNKAQRDMLYPARINSIIKSQGEGIVIMGQKTLQSKASAFDRINVRRLFLYLEKSIGKMARAFMFEFNDDFTRTRFRGTVNPFLSEVKARRGVYDYLVVCDESNNPGDVIDSNRFEASVLIKPTRVAEFINLKFVAVGTDVEFTSVVQTRA
jgi:phage tail sheath protein FI